MHSHRNCFAIFLLLLAAASVRAEEPASYPFNLQPAEALERATSLRAEGGEVKFDPGAAEERLIVWMRIGELSDDQWAEAFLIASGETDDANLRRHVEQLAELTERLRREAQGKGARETGEILLAMLHKEVMSKGYEARQSSLAELLASGAFNCVSATVLYQLQAQRLGLLMQPIEYPGDYNDGHVLTLLIDGDERIDVETTNPDGFDVRAKIAKSGASAFGIRDLKDGRPIGDVGLLLSIYGNRSVDAAKAGLPFDSLRLSLVMLALAPANADCHKRVEGALMNWVNELTEGKQYQRALEVGRVALEMAPASEGIENNVHVAHVRYADQLIGEERDEEVLRMFSAAHERWPDAEYAEETSHAFQRAAQEARKAMGWDGALDLVRRGLKQLPGDAELLELVAYAGQENLRELDQNEGAKAAVAWFELLRKEFPQARRPGGDRRIVCGQ